MTETVSVEINSRSVMDALNKLLRRGHDMKPVMDAIGMRMEERVSARFESRSDPTGHPWAKWKPSTAKSYPKDGNHSLLDRHGDMLRSLSHTSDANSVSYGFGQPYAAYHEYGTDKMARRGLLMADPNAGTLGADDESSILDLVRGYFFEVL